MVSEQGEQDVGFASGQAFTAMRDFIRESIEYPTIRLENTSLMAQPYSLPSIVRCSVMSANHSSLGALAVKSRPTRSSCTGGPGRVVLPRCFLLNTENQPLAEQIRHAVRLAITCPASRASSVRNRCPYSGSPWWRRTTRSPDRPRSTPIR